MRSFKQFLLLKESTQALSNDMAQIAKNNNIIQILKKDSSEDVEALKKEIDDSMKDMKKDPAMQAGNNEPKEEEYQKTIDNLKKRIDKIKSDYDIKIAKMASKNDDMTEKIEDKFLHDYVVYFRGAFNYDTFNNPEKYKDSILLSMESFKDESAYKQIDMKFNDQMFNIFLTKLKD